MNSLSTLFKMGKITDLERQMYLLFEEHPIGKDYIKTMCESVIMEEVPLPTNELFAWKDGRRSALRDIRLTIMKVKKLIEEPLDD